jgi:hypothetical protein
MTDDDAGLLELRDYTATAGNGEVLRERFRTRTVPLFTTLGFSLLGIGGDVDRPDRLVYMLRWRDRAAMEDGWRTFAAHPEWRAIKADTESAGPLVAEIKRTFLAEFAGPDLRAAR